MPTLKTVTVLYDSVTLSICPPQLDLHAGDWVLWHFEGVPAGQMAQIFFESPCGPFQSVKLLDSGAILGRGNVGLDGVASETYLYTALLLDSEGGPATCGASLTNLSQEKDTSPDIVVSCSPEPGGFLLAVEPATLSLYKKDTATWHVVGLPEDHFITLAFYDQIDLRKGPFKSLSVDRIVAGDGMHQFLAIGTDFEPHEETQIPYRIEVRDQDGCILATHDPLIDNLGDPPTGGG
ncbi:MAG TPA: hypothetical protein VMW27_26675 [Thermoanaerobaculia bacterium]|nr:hypothetical protein [Thermoanaerobaculia bacterium]